MVIYANLQVLGSRFEVLVPINYNLTPEAAGGRA